MGHLHLIEQLFSRGIVDELILVPTGEPWLRAHAPHASGEDRLAMARLAVNGLPEKIRTRVSVSDVEVRRAGPTYTIDTVHELQASRPDAKWILIIGSDAYTNFAQWHRSVELQRLIEVLVIARDGDGFNIDALPVSATEIRSQIQSGVTEIKYLPEPIRAYIKERKLYASK